MNKFWSVLFFAIALLSTWSLIHSSSAVGAETHAGIQNQLATLILETVQEKKTGASDVRVIRMWTESLEDHKVRAVFAYAFAEADANGQVIESTVEGEAVLYREPGEDPRLDKWVLQSVRTTGDAVIFSEGTVVTPTPDLEESETPDPEQTPAESTGG